MRVARVVVCVVVLALLAAACGDDDNGKDASSSAQETAAVRVVSQNILHGTACAPESNRCSLPERLDLFVRQLADARCPELVGLQEANGDIVELLEQRLKNICEGRYEIARDEDAGNDREVVLTTLPVIGMRRDRLAGPLRTMFWVRVAADVGVVDFVSTHLASGSDNRPCDTQTCPPPCEPSDDVGTCQARQVAELAQELADPDAVVVIGGDLNMTPEEKGIEAIRTAGYRDTHVLAGNTECDPTSGKECTSGRDDATVKDMKDPNSKQGARIDYLWLGGARVCSVGTPTGLFNGEPASGDPNGFAYPSDHTGVTATLQCETSSTQRDAAKDAPLATVPTTTVPEGSAGDDAAKAAITKTFETFYNGGGASLDERLTVLEDAELLRESFFATFGANKDLAARIKVRMDSITIDDPQRASVVYTILLDGNAVLDHLPGAAINENGQWLITRKTYCDVATQGADEIPEPCRTP